MILIASQVISVRYIWLLLLLLIAFPGLTRVTVTGHLPLNEVSVNWLLLELVA